MAKPQISSLPNGPTAGRAVRRWLLILCTGFAIVGVTLAWILGQEWLDTFLSSQAGKWMRLRFLQTFLAVYIVVAVAAPPGAIASGVVGFRARRRGNRSLAARAGRIFLVCASLLIGIGTSEAIFSWRLRLIAKPVHLPELLAEAEAPAPVNIVETSPGTQARQLRQLPASAHPDGMLDVAIIGESSAAGVPFSPRISLDKIIAWQLGRALPDKTFRPVNLAEPGITFRTALEQLGRLQRRPDLLIVYAGHNEFQSRYGWNRLAPHYRAESNLSPAALYRLMRSMSATVDFVEVNIHRFGFALAPFTWDAEEDTADTPCCTQAEYAEILEDYRRRLDVLLGDCDDAGIPTIVVVPPSNDGAFDPNRSIMSPESYLAERQDFVARLREIREGMEADPLRASAGCRRLIAEQPGFAETHYRLAQLLEAAGSFDEAREEYVKARDLDGLPFRCPTPFLEACRELGRRHGSIVVDAPRLLGSASPHRIVNDRLMHDAQHPSLNAFMIMARDAVRQLKERKAFGWPDSSPAPDLTIDDCIRQFKPDNKIWALACKSTAWFYKVTATIRRDRSWRESVQAQYKRGMELLEAGKTPDETGIPALRIREELRADAIPEQ